jgi:starvation-inducible DNA-binding protein
MTAGRRIVLWNMVAVGLNASGLQNAWKQGMTTNRSIIHTEESLPHPPTLQAYGSLVNRGISLDHKVRANSVTGLNQILADTMTLRDMYKKHHWQASGPTFYQLHLLFDKHFSAQAEMVDELAERIQTLGGVAIAMAPDVAEATRIPRVPIGREDVTVQLFRLLQAHELIIAECRELAHAVAEAGDDGTNDLLVSDVLRGNEFQVWFIAALLEGAGLAPTSQRAE